MPHTQGGQAQDRGAGQEGHVQHSRASGHVHRMRAEAGRRCAQGSTTMTAMGRAAQVATLSNLSPGPPVHYFWVTRRHSD